MAPTDEYTHGHDESVLRSHRSRTAANSAAYLLDHLTPGADVLDVGCGPGTVTLDLARLVGEGRVVGIDTVQAPLAAARELAAERGDTTTVFEVGDVYDLHFADGSFDVVHAHQVLQHLSDPVAALKQMRRVCRPGGLLAARDADYEAMTWFPGSAGLTAWLSTYRAVARSNGAEPDAGRRLLSWARSAGLNDVTTSATVWCYATEESRRWWGGGWADRVHGSDFGRQALDRGLADPDALSAMSRAWREWADAPDGWFAVLHGEILCRVG